MLSVVTYSMHNPVYGCNTRSYTSLVINHYLRYFKHRTKQYKGVRSYRMARMVTYIM